MLNKGEEMTTNMRTTNPHWIGDEPAWDIQLTKNILLKDVTERQILYLTRKHIGESYIYETVVRQYHIDALKKVKLKVRIA